MTSIIPVVCVAATTIRVCYRRVSILRSFWLKPKWTTLPSAPSVRHFSVNSPLLLHFFLFAGLCFFFWTQPLTRDVEMTCQIECWLVCGTKQNKYAE
jgi:hypothetical protein